MHFEWGICLLFWTSTYFGMYSSILIEYIDKMVIVTGIFLEQLLFAY